jgi:hypothetical protein
MTRHIPTPPAHRRPFGPVVATACAALVVGCGGTDNSSALPEAEGSIVSPPHNSNGTNTPSKPPTSVPSSSDSQPPDNGGTDDNISLGPTFFPGAPIEFGQVPVHGVETLQIGLVNDTDRAGTGPGFPFTVQSASVDVDEFVVDPAACLDTRLDVGESCTISVAFHPAAQGDYSGIITVGTSPSIGGNKSAQIHGFGGLGPPSTSPPVSPPATPTLAPASP